MKVRQKMQEIYVKNGDDLNTQSDVSSLDDDYQSEPEAEKLKLEAE